jgi:predicted nucleic acid-binding protein
MSRDGVHLDRVMRLYIDANIIVYVIEGVGIEFEKSRDLIVSALSQGARLVTSELSIAECLHGAYKNDNSKLADLFKEFMFDGDQIELVPINAEVLNQAALLGARLRLKMADSIHVATAVLSNCDAILTNDNKLRVPEELGLIRLAEV